MEYKMKKDKKYVDSYKYTESPNTINKKSTVLEDDPQKIFAKLHDINRSAKTPKDMLYKKHKILNEYCLDHYEFDTINTIHGKKTNHQELLYCENTPLATTSINKIYKGKLKIWYHTTVSDHICLSETIPYKIIDVAVKIIEHSDAAENENNEPEMLYNFKNETDFIRLYGYHIDPVKERCLLVLEWCAGGDLFSYIEKNYLCARPIGVKNKFEGRIIPISLKHIKYIVRWLISSILKCHDRDICHSDLKLDNIMFAIQDDIKSLRLIDFGASKYIHDHGRDIIYNFISTSAHYTPPEVINEFHMRLNCDFLYKYNVKGENLFKIDVWQIGVIVYILINGHFPFNSSKTNKQDRYNHIFKMIGMCEPLSFTKNKDINNIPLCSEQCIDFINKLMAYDPHNRISLKEALEHPWLRE